MRPCVSRTTAQTPRLTFAAPRRSARRCRRPGSRTYTRRTTRRAKDPRRERGRWVVTRAASAPTPPAVAPAERSISALLIAATTATPWGECALPTPPTPPTPATRWLPLGARPRRSEPADEQADARQDHKDRPDHAPA